ncbi:hypothetical protein [Demequina pelophila]|uniref:hypothetical protein n=1 Tax=Demequina pelophila TaxID=1638984 RepID=UPI0007841EBA|nr:hypothetical protein [Demequina pelophila]
MRRTDDRGSLTVEAVALTLLLLIPTLYLVLALGRVQAGAYAAESGAYAAARAAVLAGTAAAVDGARVGTAMDDAGIAAARLVAEDFGVPADAVAVELTCDPACLEPASVVEAAVTVAVPLPGVPAFARGVLPLEVTVAASAASPVEGVAP